MADISTPSANSYLLWTPFDMPSDRGNRWAVALNSKDSSILTAAQSVVIGVSFVLLWNLTCFFGMFFAAGKNGSPNRKLALVTIRNSNDPWFAFKGLLRYTLRSLNGGGVGGGSTIRRGANDYSAEGQELIAAGGEPTTPETPSDDNGEKSAAKTRTGPEAADHGIVATRYKDDFWYGLVFCILALFVYGGGIGIGIGAPSLTQIGAVAPVESSLVFYPRPPELGVTAEVLQDFGLRAPGVMRSLGSVDAAKATLRSQVSVETDTSHQAIGEDRVVSLAYGYNLTGVDMGLRYGEKLVLKVEGSCITEYGWKNETEDADNVMDLYDMWGSLDQQNWVLLNDNDIFHAPSATFIIHDDPENAGTSTPNMTYAVLVHSAHRASITSGDDPWYATELRDDEAPPAPFKAQFWMRRGRPVLSCWEKSTWSYGGSTADTVFELKEIPGIKIARVLLEVLETALGSGPMITRLGNASGDSALRSRTTSPNGVINAAESSMADDMERLILASYVATRGVFADSLLFDRRTNYESVVTGPDSLPKDGAGDFVVSDTEIQTFSLTGIVTLGAIFGALLVTNAVTSLLLLLKQNSDLEPWTLFRDLEAAQLYSVVCASVKIPEEG